MTRNPPNTFLPAPPEVPLVQAVANSIIERTLYMPAKIVGQVTDTKTLEKIERWKRENTLILAEFGTLKNFTNFLRSAGMTREEWVRESFCSLAVEDALNLLLESLLPRGKVKYSGR